MVTLGLLRASKEKELNPETTWLRVESSEGRNESV